MNWTSLDIPNEATRDEIALILIHGGYTVRQDKRKFGDKTVTYIDYKRNEIGKAST